MGKYAIRREFFPWNLFAPPISEKFLAMAAAHMKPPKFLWRDKGLDVTTHEIPCGDGARISCFVLSPKELPDKALHALDLLDPQWLIEDFWDILRDPAKVSINLLTDEDVQVHEIDGKQIIAITVPPAETRCKPVYLLQNPYRETYRRCGEGDYRCSREEVDAMFAEAQEAKP